MAERKNLEPTLPPLLPATKAVMATLMESNLVQQALKLAVDQDDQCVDEQVEITQIPSSPFGEELRGKDIVERFTRYGLKNIQVDEVGSPRRWSGAAHQTDDLCSLGHGLFQRHRFYRASRRQSLLRPFHR